MIQIQSKVSKEIGNMELKNTEKQEHSVVALSYRDHQG